MEKNDQGQWAWNVVKKKLYSGTPALCPHPSWVGHSLMFSLKALLLMVAQCTEEQI